MSHRLLLPVVLLLPLLLSVPACGTGALPAARGYASGPYVAHLEPTTAMIAWKSVEPAHGVLRHGPVGGAMDQVEDGAVVLEHRFLLEGLEPGGAYRYQAFDGEEPIGGEHVFHTPSDAPDAPVRFAVMGDTGTGLPQALAVFDGVASVRPDLVLLTGDCAYSDGSAMAVHNRFVLPLADLMAETPLYLVLGNHDVETSGGQPLLDAVFLPTNAVTGTERFYALTRGNCRFVALDSTRALGAGSVQHAWLEAELAASEVEWTFLFLHHPAYSSSRHGSSVLLQAALVPLCDAHGVDIVFCGHDHDYERTFPLRGGLVQDAAFEPDYVDPEGTVFVVTGGGASLYEAGTSEFTAFSESIAHFVKVDVEGGHLALEAIDTSGQTIDGMTITKSR